MAEYIEPQTTRHGNCIVTVRRPVLTEVERAKRMEAVKRAAENVLRSTLNIHRKEEQHGKPHHV